MDGDLEKETRKENIEAYGLEKAMAKSEPGKVKKFLRIPEIKKKIALYVEQKRLDKLVRLAEEHADSYVFLEGFLAEAFSVIYDSCLDYGGVREGHARRYLKIAEMAPESFESLEDKAVKDIGKAGDEGEVEALLFDFKKRAKSYTRTVKGFTPRGAPDRLFWESILYEKMEKVPESLGTMLEEAASAMKKGFDEEESVYRVTVAARRKYIDMINKGLDSLEEHYFDMRRSERDEVMDEVVNSAINFDEISGTSVQADLQSFFHLLSRYSKRDKRSNRMYGKLRNKLVGDLQHLLE